MGPYKSQPAGIKILVDDIENSSILDFSSYAKVVSKIILGSEPKFSIGVYGDWGIGKTSLMKLIEKNLVGTGIMTIWFNAWKYEREDQFALIALMKTIAYEMKDHSIYKQIAPIIKRAGKAIVKDALTQTASVFLTESGIKELKKAKPVTDLLSAIEHETSYFDAMEKIESEIQKILKKYRGARVVIFIDDLDRCSPKTTVEVFESIKVFLGMEGFIYVLGLNYNTIIELIAKAYEGAKIDSEKYLQKIIQIPISLPSWNISDIEQLVENLSRKLDPPYSNVVSKNKGLIARVAELNPREAKRFINSCILGYELYSGNKQEINFEDLLVVQALKLRWPRFHAFFSSLDPMAVPEPRF